jgi:hypothetical protein
VTDVLPLTWRPPAGTRRIDHPERRRMRESPARVKIAAGGRRSGKSMDALDYLLVGHGPRVNETRRMFSGALCPPVDVADPTYLVAAPTYEMVERLWWPRIKQRLTPDWIVSVRERPKLTIELVTGARIICVGMDRPTRAEGMAVDGFIGDEYAYFKPGAFTRSIRPALSTRGRPPGWAILMFKPDGRNHAFDLWDEAKNGKLDGYEAFHWTSSVVIDPAELQSARETMDARSFAQEYEASFLTQTGRVFDPWDAARHVRKVEYRPDLPLVFTLDFNVSPGAAVAIQEQTIDGEQCTAVVWEHYRADDNTAARMCEAFRNRFAGHKGEVYVYGDVGGNQRHTNSDSTDWQVVMADLRQTFNAKLRVGKSAPSIVDSVNAVCSRLLTMTGKVHLVVDPSCAHTIKDFEGVVWDDRPGAERKIDKSDGRRTHWVDAIRYYVHERHPIQTRKALVY